MTAAERADGGDRTGAGRPPAESFFEQVADDRFRATAACGGPWDPTAQHGGPPAALLGRAVECTTPRDDMRVARVTVEILGPVPVGELTVTGRVVRPGRSVELVEATLAAGDRVAARALAWRVLATPADVPLDGLVGERPAVPPLPPHADPGPVADWHDGYLSSVEWRFVHGGFDRRGPATVWTRARVPLVAGEAVSPLQRVLLVADSGNGVSNALPIRDWWFINPELTVHLFRLPVGEWVALDARTAFAPGGAGLAESVLHDADGPIGRGAQALLVAPR